MLGRARGPSASGGDRVAKGLASFVCPHEYRRSVYDVDARELKRRGIDGLIVDVDNTLVEWDKHEVTTQMEEWFDKARDAGVSCCIVSNSTRASKVSAFARSLGAEFICPATKPLPSSFRSAMRRLGTHSSNTAVIGDQVFTDILGGNALGLRTILVQPVSPREFAWTRLIRKAERLVLRYLKARGLMPGDAPHN